MRILSGLLPVQAYCVSTQLRTLIALIQAVSNIATVALKLPGKKHDLGLRILPFSG